MQLAAQPRPRFRTDLVAECIEANGQRFIDVIDPDTGDAFRFFEVEYSLACAMDGQRDLAGLAQWAREELGIEPSAAELSQVISTLDNLGYLGGDGEAVAASAVPAPAVAPAVAAAPAPVVAQPAPRALEVELGTPGLTQGWSVPETGLPPVEQLELGAPGATPAAPPVAAGVDDIELGLPGAGEAALPPVEPMPVLRRTSNPSSDEDGPTNLPAPATSDGADEDEVSVNLGDHLALRPDDVKEAVRASQRMSAVDPAALEELARAEAAQAAPVPSPVPPPVVEAAPVPPPVVEAAPVVAAKPEPRAPEPATRTPASTQPEPEGSSKGMLWLLALVLLGAAAFLAWKFLLAKPAEEPAVQPPVTQPVVTPPVGGGTTVVAPGGGTAEPGAGGGTAEPGAGSGTAEPGAGSGTAEPGAGSGAAEPGAGSGSAVLPSATPARAVLAPAEPSAVVKAVADGVVDTAAKVGAQVNSGDVVVRLKGAAQLERKLGNPRQGLVWDVEARYPNEIAKLTAARDKAVAAADAAEAKKLETRLKERTARLEEQKGKLAELRAALSALVLAAPADGVVASAPKAGQRVAAGQDVVALAGAPGLMATFELAGSPAPAPGATVNVAAEAAPDKPVPCVVAAVEGSRVMVTCPEQAGLAAGPALLSLTAP